MKLLASHIQIALILFGRLSISICSQQLRANHIDINNESTRKEMAQQYKEIQNKIHGKSSQVTLLSNEKEKIKVLIKFKKGTDESIISSIIPNNTMKLVDRLDIYSLYITYDEIQLLNDYIEYIEPDGDVFIIDEDVTNRRRLTESLPWGITSVLQDYDFWSDELIKKQTNNKIKICVCDTGYELGHEDLPSSPDVIGFDNPDISEQWSYDGHGHGTHVAGTIAAIGSNDKGVGGVIPNNQNGNFELMITKAFSSSGSGSESTVLNAVEACVNNTANIISLSLGSMNYNKITSDYYHDLYVNKGILVISASGNGGVNDFMYPSGYPSVMGVAAVDNSYERAHFSQYNSQVEISGPGVDVYSTFRGNTYKYYDGTSMATPHVSAVAGLLWMYFPECTNQQIRNVMLASAKKIGDSTCNEETGYGFVQSIDAYKLLEEGNCGEYFKHTDDPLGGCEQVGTHSKPCMTNEDCNDNDPCTVDTCNLDGNTCMHSIDCRQCNKIDKVTVNLLPDSYPTEITWEIKRKNKIVMQGGPYPEMKLYSKSQCLDEGIHVFTIHDSYGDGIQDDGYFELTLGDELIKSGGNYTKFEIVSFNVVDTTTTIKPTEKATNEKQEVTKKPKTKKPKKTKKPTEKPKKTKKPTKHPKTKKPTKKPKKSEKTAKPTEKGKNHMEKIRKKIIKKNTKGNERDIKPKDEDNEPNEAWKRLKKLMGKKKRRPKKNKNA